MVVHGMNIYGRQKNKFIKLKSYLILLLFVAKTTFLEAQNVGSFGNPPKSGAVQSVGSFGAPGPASAGPQSVGSFGQQNQQIDQYLQQVKTQQQPQKGNNNIQNNNSNPPIDQYLQQVKSQQQSQKGNNNISNTNQQVTTGSFGNQSVFNGAFVEAGSLMEGPEPQADWSMFTTCDVCNGSGKINQQSNCDKCGGLGSFTCSDCRGAGQTGCDACDRKGYELCSGCNGQGSVTSIVNNIVTPCFVCGGSGRMKCSSCYGKGYRKCYSCKGAGKITCSKCKGDRIISKSFTCPKCDGFGKIVK